MKDRLKDFIDLYIESKLDVGKIINLILEDDNSYYINSQDVQLMDISYEYDFKLGKESDELRFSYFGTKIYFLDKLYESGFIDNFKIKESYLKYKNCLKDDLVTFSFIFKNNRLDKIKLYFDIDVTLLKKENIILNKIKDKLDEKIVLVAFTFKDSRVKEEKYYYELNSYIYLYSSLFLKKNKNFLNYKKNVPFEVLFREDGLGKLLSIKYYYKNISKNNCLFENKQLFTKCIPIEKSKKLNLKEEVGVDFNLTGGINKIDYYIGLYK